MRQIIFDCDDVLLNWIAGFRQYAATRLQHSVVGEPQSWMMGEWLGCTNEAAFELVEEFNAGPHFGRLEAVEGAQQGIYDLTALRVNYLTRLHVVTSCSSDAATVRLRRDNLEDVFGKQTFDSIHCLDLGQPKTKILQAWEPGTIWVEDNYKNAVMGADVGHRVLIRKRPHNLEYQDLHDERLTWFEHWSELKDLI